jgi:hypothetical protein
VAFQFTSSALHGPLLGTATPLRLQSGSKDSRVSVAPNECFKFNFVANSMHVPHRMWHSTADLYNYVGSCTWSEVLTIKSMLNQFELVGWPNSISNNAQRSEHYQLIVSELNGYLRIN